MDYKSFIKSFYFHEEEHFWQKGIRWILRGVVHLIIYQLIYNNLIIPKEEVTNLTSLLIHSNANYLLIFRLSGMFHLVVGLLCIFGFSLHPIFNNYFLATSFVNLWRRINIYWREFIMKLFFYPLIFKLKKVNPKYSLPITMMFMFFITWILHNYQWFWIRGNFPISLTDALFWITIGSCVTFNSILEAKRVKSKTPKPKKNIANAITNILKMIALFLFMATMWTLWSSKNVEEWFFLLSQSGNFTFSDIGLISLVISSILVLGIFITQLLKNKTFYSFVNKPSSKTLSLTLPSLILLAAIGYQPIKQKLPKSTTILIDSISNKKITSENKHELEQGYYEKLLDGEGKNVTSLWEVEVKRTKTFSPLDEVA
ncbi:MAG: hypothetical protein P1U41_05010, partial [Vicingaceae bacterium]|nr:hypothetical protein [Vicingaceae bacterium]